MIVLAILRYDQRLADMAGGSNVSEQVAADRARVLGQDHPDTLHSRHEHAWNISRVRYS